MSENPEQLSLDLRVAVAAEVDGLEMGVLNDGTPYLNGRSLARACGVAYSTIIEFANEYNPKSDRNRDQKIAEILAAQGFDGDRLYIPIETPNGAKTHAYSDIVCMAVLEYYAFDQNRPEALTMYRVLARRSLREFIYAQTGYSPRTSRALEWEKFRDRLLFNPVPSGFFSVFREMAEFVLRAMQQGLPHDEHTIPDISVGQIWSAYWTNNNLDQTYGPRSTYEHRYPDYYPQAAAGPRDAYMYPMAALGIFRQWLDEVYLPEKFPNYLKNKVRQGIISKSVAQGITAALEPPKLGPASGGV